MLLMFGRVVLKYLKNIFIGCYKIIFPLPLQSSICPYQVHLGGQMGTSPSTSSYSCYFAFPAPRTQTFGRRPTPPWVHLYGRRQSLGQSFMRSITPVGATGPLFPPRGLLPCMRVNSGTLFLKVNLVETYGFTPKYPTKLPANPKSCRLHDKACYSWQK